MDALNNRGKEMNGKTAKLIRALTVKNLGGDTRSKPIKAVVREAKRSYKKMNWVEKSLFKASAKESLNTPEG